MRVIVFDQWERLVAAFRGMATQTATSRSQYDIVRVEPKGGRACLSDRSANQLSVSGGLTTVVLPDIEPGKARDLMLRVTATGENALKFEGADAFEGDEGALEPPGDGETCVYFFTEAAAGVMLVARRTAKRIETE